MYKCERMITEQEAGGSGLIGPCGREAVDACLHCQLPLCKEHLILHDKVPHCALCLYTEHGLMQIKDSPLVYPDPLIW